ncbi:hypothetical protein [Bradyrhizobium sp. 2TAF24]|uniref:hypothetical protein n=1 Tax=Bradyrhizobium sp. 2TAF24 TaxID=3233011 RepID=UPI003F917857
MFDILMANGVPREQAMAVAFAGGSRDGYDGASASSVAPRGASAFSDPPALQGSAATDPGSAGIRRRPEGGYDLDPSYLNPRLEERRVPGIDPGQAGIRPPPGESYYLYPEPERRHASGWGDWVRPTTRESLGLSPESSEQFAGVPLAGDADRGYRLDPDYMAQVRTALNTEPHIPSEREKIVRGGKFYAGAAPFGFAGPGSLNFDPSLESSTRTLAPFRRPLENLPQAPRPKREGNFAGAVGGVPIFGVGVGGGAYFDSDGYYYPQVYIGTPGVAASAASSGDLEGQLTGLSGTFSAGKGGLGGGVTFGWGPWKIPEISWPLG